MIGKIMKNIKSYTDLEQSHKLAEILPLESADMIFQLGEDKYADSIRVPLIKIHWEQLMPDINPCWSLSALLSVLPKGYSLGRRTNGKYYVCMTNIKHNISEFDNPVDAAYEMILKLHEMKLL